MTTTLEAPVHTTVVGVFDNHARARVAVEDLRRAGFPDDRIGFMGPEPGAPVGRAVDHDPAEAAGVGAAVGAAAGGAAGLVVAAAMFTPIGPVVLGGALATWLATVGVGVTAGAALGALVGFGLPEHEARWYEGELKAGRTLVLVHEADERAEDARHILRRHGGSVQEPSEFGSYGTGLPATPF